MVAPPWTPPSAAVAPHLRQFLRGPTGQQLEDFTTTTTITQVEVLGAIGSVVGDVAAAVGTVPEDLEDQAAAVTAIGAAAEAVIDRDLELHRALTDLFESRLKRLITAVQDARDGTVDGTSADVPASGWFPAAFGVDRRYF
jgi:hypothetical protein